MKTSSKTKGTTAATKRVSIRGSSKSITKKPMKSSAKPKEHKRVLSAEGWKRKLLKSREL